ncbi:glycosyltransferase [Paenibacillus sp. JJ-223]|uniref:glycosyltransferase n=1 Tax=Paenibacillus sp. JJ-223 TaxID=2905647 RepID=UPI001F1DAC61|nr:glycosyltransferase [Paenibacillus sp. JJ-223]CAH1223472.1 Ubiquinone biosynthesis O-methyltransferase, mitochondrial [Paenibacillus sp. JJ-223]
MDFTGERFIPHETDEELQIEHTQRYNMLNRLVENKVVLDAACGEGYGSFLLSNSASKVTGIDIDPQTIGHARKKYVKENLDYFVTSIEHMPFPDQSFDIVVSFETLEHVDEKMQLAFLKEVQRLLKENGTLIISTPNKKYYSDQRGYSNAFHVKELYREEFFELLKEHFAYVNIVSQRFEVVSLIDNPSSERETEFFVQEQQKGEAFEKYMIAFCSNDSRNAKPTHSITVQSQKYQNFVERVMTLQDEVEERNQHIALQNKEIDFLREKFAQLDSLRKKFTQLESVKEDLNLQLEHYKNEQRAAQKELADLENVKQRTEMELQTAKKELGYLSHQLSEQLVQIENQKGHIELLLQEERILQNIYNSGGWRFLNRYYRLRDRLIPMDSKRRMLLKLAKMTVQKPKIMLTALNKSNLRKLKYYLKSEETTRVNGRIDNYIAKYDDKPLPVLQVAEPDTINFEHLSFPIEEKPKVSIIIPVYNQWKYTYSCLASILGNTSNVPYEIIIADDMSNDDTVNIGEYVSNVTVVRDGVNRGFLLNCNNAATYAKGEYLFFLNNDTNVQPNWLSSLVELMESDSKIGMTGSKLVYPDGRQQEAGGIIWNDASGWNYGRLDDPEKPEYNYVKEADYISGAAILIRHTIWQELGGFDERYVPAYFEDTDLAFEVRRLGYKVLLQPKSVIVHFEGISHGTDTNSGIKSYQVKNKEKFLQKWSVTLQKDHFPNAEHVFWARDRSRNRKTIVVVDHYVPHYDKDAGGRATYFYLKLFVSMGFHVIFIGDNFFRHEPYTSNLQELGIEVLYGDYYAKNINKWIKHNGSYIDYVYLNRPHISIKYMETFKKFTSAKIIYFGHDLHFLREMRNFELTGNTHLIKSSEEWKKTEFSLFNDADVIHVVGSYEQSLLQNEFPDKPVRNIPLFPYDQPYANASHVEGFDARKDILFVGGFNHTPNYDGIVWFLDEIFGRIKKQIPNVKLYIVGSNPPDDLKAKSADDVIVTGFVSDEELERYYNRSRLVIVPLRYGAGVKGKVVEALYYQVPIVTTSIGSEGLEEAEMVMTIAEDAHQFADSVIQLYQDETVWNSYFEESVQYIEKYFTREAARSILALDFKD